MRLIKETERVKIGDEVITYGEKGIVVADPFFTSFSGEQRMFLIWYGTRIKCILEEDVNPTGKTYPEIPKILQEIKGVDDETRNQKK